MTFIENVLKRQKIFFIKLFYFGFSVAFWDLIESQKHKINISSDKLIQKKHNTIINWLQKNMKDFIMEYLKNNQATTVAGNIPKKIWMCWWDGIDSMPPIVRACYNSVLHHAGDYEIIVITKDNFISYLTIPDHVIKKFNNKIITANGFANIIRMSLLNEYGGLWLDATVLVTNDINIDSCSFFTICGNYGGEDVPKRRWTTNCIGGIRNIFLFHFIRDFLCEYWRKYNYLIDYFLFDYSIALAYDNILNVKELIDNVHHKDEHNIINYMFLQDHLEDEYNSDFFDETVNKAIFHKLSWKNNYSTHTAEGNLTNYGYILEKYGK